jgi:hypothetical protein
MNYELNRREKILVIVSKVLLWTSGTLLRFAHWCLFSSTDPRGFSKMELSARFSTPRIPVE